jgi:hypothetical protein
MRSLSWWPLAFRLSDPARDIPPHRDRYGTAVGLLGGRLGSRSSGSVGVGEAVAVSDGVGGVVGVGGVGGVGVSDGAGVGVGAGGSVIVGSGVGVAGATVTGDGASVAVCVGVGASGAKGMQALSSSASSPAMQRRSSMLRSGGDAIIETLISGARALRYSMGTSRCLSA